MLIIHQRKSAGTSLVHTLANVLGNKVEESVKVTVMNTKGKPLFRFLSDYISRESPIKSIHLHPTKENMDWIRDNDIKCVILLRNPADSYQALKRHRDVDNVFRDANSTIYYKKSEAILEEFHYNWLCLRDKPNILIVFFEDLVTNPNNEIQRILDFYEYEINLHEIQLEKKRYSGVGIKGTMNKGMPNKNGVQFPKYEFDPDYKSFVPRNYWRIKVYIKKIIDRAYRKFVKLEIFYKDK